MELCIECKERPVHIKKRGLCGVCYQRLRKSGQIEAKFRYTDNNSTVKIKHNAEIEFCRTFFDHKKWHYEPTLFRLKTELYTPDFYDAERNVFIEVVGTRQAYYQNRSKYENFREQFPKINLEIRTANGDLLDEDKPNWKSACPHQFEGDVVATH